MISQLLANRELWTAVLANLTAQIWKVLWVSYKERRLAGDRLFETGGMPSSHSAAVTALATSIGLRHGLDSASFAVSVIFGAIVIYDATGVRQAAGMHAHMLNDLARELQHILTEGFQPRTLQTLLGHTVPQVIVGVILGLAIGLVFNL